MSKFSDMVLPDEDVHPFIKENPEWEGIIASVLKEMAQACELPSDPIIANVVLTAVQSIYVRGYRLGRQGEKDA